MTPNRHRLEMSDFDEWALAVDALCRTHLDCGWIDLCGDMRPCKSPSSPRLRSVTPARSSSGGPAARSLLCARVGDAVNGRGEFLDSHRSRSRDCSVVCR